MPGEVKNLKCEQKHYKDAVRILIQRPITTNHIMYIFKKLQEKPPAMVVLFPQLHQ